MALKVSNRGTVPPFIVMDVMQAAAEREAEGEHVLHLEVGQPHTRAPGKVLEAAKNALDQDRIGYTVALGIPELRNRIVRYYRDHHGIDVDPDHVMITTGSSCGFLLSFLSAFEAGDKVALASPGYPAYRNILRAVGIEVVDLLTGPETNFQPTPDLIENCGENIDGLIIASPSNPAGTMIGDEDLEALCRYCDEQGIRLISDEIYHRITYEKGAQTSLAYTQNAIIINSFSKYFSMTGWRLGWMVVPEDLIRAVVCLAQNLFISPPTLSQHAGIAAFDCEDELQENLKRYAANRALLLDELPKAGFDRLASADGAFYIYADVSALTNDSTEFCRRMLNEIGVASTPGIDFDPSRGHHYVRFSFAGSTEDMAEAASRLKAWLG